MANVSVNIKAVSGAERQGRRAVVYVVPPISSLMILPHGRYVPGTPSSEISVVAARGEYEPASFVVSTMVDLRILAGLARYHSHRVLAGVSWAAFKHSQDAAALDDAIAHEARAVEAWAGIVTSAGDVYHGDLMMGRRRSGLSGHWKDELVKLKAGLAKMRRQRKDFKPKAVKGVPVIAHAPVRRAGPGKDFVVRATIAAKGKLKNAHLAWSSADVAPVRLNMEPAGPNVYRAVISGTKVHAGLTYFLQVIDESGKQATWPPRGQAAPIAVTVTRDTAAPTVVHEPVVTAPAEKPLVIAATVRDPAGVKWVRLRYRSVTQFEDYRTLAMTPTGKANEYRCVVPAEHVPARWDFMYLIEVMDRAGNGAIWPDLNDRTPYIVVRLKR